ncbi:hypothetical protein M9H77_26685 [Catharanthus roseus]|uniref:Uncharacterized protein n=1 Tax=Catharanthus roseus TaxID=4058 RepID=A0ACC0ABS3_CATRO|nr:hypothetical protein M9H77_26685 [Catharanthus roseus]
MALELWKKEIKKARGYNEANFKREAVTNSSFAEKTEEEILRGMRKVIESSDRTRVSNKPISLNANDKSEAKSEGVSPTVSEEDEAKSEWEPQGKHDLDLELNEDESENKNQANLEQEDELKSKAIFDLQFEPASYNLSIIKRQLRSQDALVER